MRVAASGTLAERSATCFASRSASTSGWLGDRTRSESPLTLTLLYMEGDFMNARGEKHSGRDRSTPSGSTKTVREHGSSRPSTQTRTVAWATRAASGKTGLSQEDLHV